MSLSLPTQLTQAFCSAGVKNTVPNPSQISVNAGLASFTDGFPPATRAPVASGGIPPYGEDMNGILNQLSLPIQWQQAGGAYPYSSAFATAIGGYPLAGRTYSSDGSGYWLNTTANNTNDPENTAAPNGWQPVDQRGITTVPLTNANVTLTNLQSAKDTVVFTGTLTGPVVVTVAQFIKDFKFINQTTGAFALQVKTLAGSAITLGSGATVLRGDGATLNQDVNALTSGRLINTQRFTSSGTYTPTPGTTFVIVDVQAAGGGSGTANAAASGNGGGGGSGGGGCFTRAKITSGFSGATITVGAGGAAGVAAPQAGGTGGASSFGTLVSCPGGLGGGAGGSTSTAQVSQGAGTSNQPTINSPATLLFQKVGNAAGPTIVGNAGSTVFTGNGGDSFMGEGAYGQSSGAAGRSPSLNSGGGASAAASPSGTGPFSGAAGGAGIVIIYEFA